MVALKSCPICFAGWYGTCSKEFPHITVSSQWGRFLIYLKSLPKVAGYSDCAITMH